MNCEIVAGIIIRHVDFYSNTTLSCCIGFQCSKVGRFLMHIEIMDPFSYLDYLGRVLSHF